MGKDNDWKVEFHVLTIQAGSRDAELEDLIEGTLGKDKSWAEGSKGTTPSAGHRSHLALTAKSSMAMDPIKTWSTTKVLGSGIPGPTAQTKIHGIVHSEPPSSFPKRPSLDSYFYTRRGLAGRGGHNP